MFAKPIGKTMKVYVDDMLVNSLKSGDQDHNLKEMFMLLRWYKRKLNPNKCAFDVDSGKFLVYIIN